MNPKSVTVHLLEALPGFRIRRFQAKNVLAFRRPVRLSRVFNHFRDFVVPAWDDAPILHILEFRFVAVLTIAGMSFFNKMFLILYSVYFMLRTKNTHRWPEKRQKYPMDRVCGEQNPSHGAQAAASANSLIIRCFEFPA